jgi:hypothetical protein
MALSIGAMITYFMDAMQYREGAMTCVWGTLVATDAAFVFSLFATSAAPVWLQIGLMCAMGATTVLSGIWASLQVSCWFVYPVMDPGAHIGQPILKTLKTH